MGASAITIAAGTADITPRAPAALGGYVERAKPFERVADPLEANVVIVESPSSRIVFVTIDSLYPGRILRDALKDALDLKDEELFLAASHTHFAPMISPGMPLLGAHDAAYAQYAAEQIVKAVRSIDGRGVAAQCFYACGLADHAMNRRLKHLRLTRAGVTYSCGLGPNPAGEKDERIHTVRFANDAGDAVALLWSYACHPTDFPERYHVSADYPGVVRARLRHDFGDIPILFLQGFSGDLRPPFHGLTLSPEALLRRVLQGPAFRTPAMTEWRAWAGGLAERVLSAVRSGTPAPLGAPQTQRTVVSEEKLGDGGHGDKPLVWHRADCGAFRVIGANAEPVCAYRGLIEPGYRDRPLITAGCIDQTHGYLPVDRMLLDGGYEVEGFRRLFAYATTFRPGLQAAATQPLLRG